MPDSKNPPTLPNKKKSLRRRLALPVTLLLAAVGVGAGVDPFNSSAPAPTDNKSGDDGFNAQYRDYVAQALKLHAEAQSEEEWEGSGYTPKDIVRNAIESRAVEAPKALCQALDALRPEDLALFGDELTSIAASRALPCADSLNGRVKEFWKHSSDTLSAEISAQHANEREEMLPGNDDSEIPAKPIPTLEVSVDASKGEVYPIRGELKEGQVAITVDDGPFAGRTERLLDALKERQVRVTFFEVGERAAREPELSRREVAEGHTVGSHSMNHPNMKRITEGEAKRNILQGREAVKKASGVDTAFFRFPYAARTEGLTEFVKEQGMASFLWNMDTLDWQAKDAQTVYHSAIRELDEHKGGIILFHDRKEGTIIALPHFIDELNRRGYQTVVFVPH
jgi:peptidoglycan/xylan/chitin deacetylase (PgdA/CDA1 family)